MQMISIDFTMVCCFFVNHGGADDMKRTHGIAKNNYEIVRGKIAELQRQSFGSYGYRRMTAALKACGFPVNHKLVLRLMREDHMCCETRKKQSELPEKTFSTYHANFGTKSRDLICRDYHAEHFGEVWATDMTEIRAGERKLYLVIVIDHFNSEIVGYRISDQATLAAVLSAIGIAHNRYRNVHPILHSDRGWFYCADSYIAVLKRYGYERSMTQTGSCYDNATAESFFAQLKTELIYQQEWITTEELIRAIHEYIFFYNNHRVKKKLGYKSPVQYRREHSKKLQCVG